MPELSDEERARRRHEVEVAQVSIELPAEPMREYVTGLEDARKAKRQ